MTRPELSRRVGRIPALAAGPPPITSTIKTPLTYFLGDLFFDRFHSQPGLIIFPLRINSGTIRLTVSAGMAKAIPAEPPDGL
jgi:hypothetical protein